VKLILTALGTEYLKPMKVTTIQLYYYWFSGFNNLG